MDGSENLPSASGDDYVFDTEEMAFLRAMEEYMRTRKRRFPTYREVLAVARSLGYRRVAEPTPLPTYGRSRKDKEE